MTESTLPHLLAAIQNSDDGDFLRVLAETMLNRLMDFDSDNATGAGRHESAAAGGGDAQTTETSLPLDDRPQTHTVTGDRTRLHPSSPSIRSPATSTICASPEGSVISLIRSANGAARALTEVPVS